MLFKGFSKSHHPVLLAGILAGSLLMLLAMIILVQLLGYDNGQGSPFSRFLLTELLGDERLIRTVIFTIFQASLSTILSIFFGLILAWSLANRQHFFLRNILIALISSALVLPTLVVVLGIVSLYGRNGWLASISHWFFGEPLPFSIYGLSGILIAHVFFNASFAARIFLHRFEAIPDEKHKLCFALGLGFHQKMKLVEFPAIRGALPTTTITIFLLCFTSFAIVLTLGGSPSYNTLEVAIYEAIKFDFDLPRASILAIVQIVICALLVFGISAGTDDNLFSAYAQKTSSLEHLNSARRKIFQNLVILIFSAFFILPLFAVIIDGVGQQLVAIFKDPVFLTALVTSLFIAFASTIAALVFSFCIASAIVTLCAPTRKTYAGTSQSDNHLVTSLTLSGNILARILVVFLSTSAMLYLVFPALVLGQGSFIIFQKIGGNANLWATLIVITANALIAIPFGLASLRAAIFEAANKNDRLCASLGLGRWHRWKIIDWPMLKTILYMWQLLPFVFHWEIWV